jgi:VWFA-related protein
VNEILPQEASRHRIKASDTVHQVAAILLCAERVKGLVTRRRSITTKKVPAARSFPFTILRCPFEKSHPAGSLSTNAEKFMLAASATSARRAFAVIAIIVVVSLANHESAHAQAIPPAPAPAPTIVTNADEVSVDFVVRDKKNKPVLDLKPADIAVSDSGSPVKIADLRLVTGDSSSQHLVTLVFDRLDPSAGKNARDIVAKILKMAPASGISFSVLKVEGRLRLFQEFTSDRNLLTKAINMATDDRNGENGSAAPEKNLIAVAQTGVDLGGATMNTTERSIARVMLASLEESQRIVQDQHASSSLAGLMALARTQRQVKGRKIVIYFAQGMKLDSDGKDMLRSVIGAANQSGVSIYAIDTNAIDPEAGQGLIATAAIGGVMTNNHLHPSVSNDPDFATKAGNATRAAVPGPPLGSVRAGNEQLDRLENQGLGGYQDPLVYLSAGTGGECMSAADSLKKPLRDLIEDMTTYYEASYVPSIENYDGQFRPVAVKPVRAGLKIHSTAGYFAVPPGASSGIRPFEAPLLKILSEQQLPSDLKFRSRVLRMGDLPDGNANALVVEVPLSELEIHKDSNTHLFSAHLSIVAQVRNKAGETVEHFSEDIPRHGSFETLDEAQSEVITLQRHFGASPGEYVLEAVVMDRNSGKASAQRTNFEIPKVPNGPSLSDVALVRRTDPFKAETDPLEPLRYENGRIVPDLSGDITNKAKSISLFFMIHPDPQSSEQARLQMEVLRNGDPVASMPLPLRKTSGHGPVPYLASIQAGSLPAGRYDVTATLTEGEKTTASSTSFVVGGAEIASAAMPVPGANPTATAPSNAIETVSDSKLQNLGIESRQTGRLTITSITDPIPPPAPDQLEAMVADSRAHALGYSVSLPNFTCVEMTDRSVDPSGTGRWKHKDTYAELLRDVDNTETRSMLRVNGQRSTMQRSDLNGPISRGEFGGVLNAVFQGSSKADFQYKETDALGAGTVQVLAYRVARQNSSFSLTDSNQQINVGFHGLVYVDSATKSVRRITLDADDVPHNFALHSTSITVDYDYIAIGTHDYLVPIRASVSLTRGRREAVLNEIEFRNYRRYASQARVLYGNGPLR